MKKETISLVQESWGKVALLGPAAEIYYYQNLFTALFYQNLFTADPSIKPLFKGGIAQQGQKFIKMIGTAIDMLNDLDTLTPLLQQLAKSHVGYGVQESHYQTVGAALIRTLEQGLAEDFTPDVKEAWSSIYKLMANVMIAASKA